ncbi:MAG: HDIG domain-containing protein [Spirochaetes bacterium]|nr:HDIG domain-containing protein [Spirochaetota bacterium]
MPSLFEFDPHALELCRRLVDKGFEAYIVGGAVRDSLLGRPTGDVDIATSARPPQVMALFRNTIPTGLKHGTLTVIQGGKPFEVTTFRADGTYSDGRHPDQVAFSDTLEEDLARRDFTINALAWSPVTESLVDRWDGTGDLGRKLIRTIGDPRERFGEDALRMMRACRFSAQLGFAIDAAAAEAMRALAANLKQVSAERLRDELSKILLSPSPSTGLEACRVTGLLPVFLPELNVCWGVDQNSFHRYDVYWHILKTLDAFTPADALPVRLAGLFHDIAKPQTRRPTPGKSEPVFYNHEVVGAAMAGRIMRRLKFSNDEVATVTHLVRHHMFHYTPTWTKGAVRRFIRNVGPDQLPTLFSLRNADRLGNGKREATCDEIEEFKVKISEVFAEQSALAIKDLAIGGHDLMEAFQLAPGPLIGRTLHHLLELVLDDPSLNEREGLLKLSGEYLAAGAPKPAKDDSPSSDPA